MSEMPKTIMDEQGWFDWQPYYFRIANAVPDGSELVELGPWLGVSTIFLAHCLQAFGKNKCIIHAVDTWRGSPSEQALFDNIIAGGSRSARQRFDAAIASHGVEKLINPVMCDSLEAAHLRYDKSIDFVFFDTEHTEEHLSAELAVWLPKMKPGIWFGGHDIAVPGVRRAVEKHVKHWWVDGPCWEAKND